MEQYYENPWKVSAIEDFQFFCCPECDTRNHSKDDFLTHALETHPDAKEALKDILGICTVIEVKTENADEDDLSDFEQKPDLEESNEPEESFEDIPEDYDDDFYDQSDINETKDSFLPNFEASIETKSAESEAKSFPSEISIQTSGSSAFTCKTCKITFSSLTKLVNHKLSVHGSGGQKSSDVKRQHNIVSCKYCKAKYGSDADLKKHMLARHKSGLNQTEEVNNSKGTSSSKLNMHLQNVHGSEIYPCKVCKAKFDSEADQKNHSLERHKLVIGGPEGDSFQCATCNAQFKTSLQLNKHENYYHKSAESYNCEFCGKIFTAKASLNYHIKNFHEKGQSEEYSCESCGKKFVNNKIIIR